MSLLDKVKKAGKSVVDAGAKTMLKVSLRRRRFSRGRICTFLLRTTLGVRVGGHWSKRVSAESQGFEV